ncbi:right-handed parallel beta-helix repeat-containing protein [Haloferula rosea]|uniref:Right-handed parallel beta-helix repeat-containing protein n=1 Tax=Haloferula rosea TaxID=490093 RepID=A0A934R858_9BACT|nr:right-handed parallel beta-helix repeat-containing protein [Haloferula rosea]MBK1825670.1 right-handed parallel beta-helix repeat-containing protein [Haloferula rosea]
MNTTPIHLVAGLLLLWTTVANPAVAREAGVIDVRELGAKPDGSDTTPSVRAALEAVRKGEGSKITFGPGRYDFYPDRAFEEYLFVSNNDEGLKRIAFPLKEMDGLEIDGGGATFVFHGYTVPFLISGSSQVKLRNFSVDFSRPFHSEGKVLAITPQHVDLEFTEHYPFEIRNGVLVFTNGKKAKTKATTVTSGEVVYPYGSLLAFDPIKQETAFMAKDRYQVGAGIAAHPIGPNRIRLRIPNISARVGEILVFSPKNRDVPGVIVTDSSGVRLTDITLHHCGGMGVIAQRSADLFYTRLKVTPPSGGHRIISTTADATHFVNCRGRIEMVDCLFEQQKDDPTNVHGLYAKITHIFAPNRFEVSMIHPQQAGVDFIGAGTRLELNDGPSLTEEGFANVKSVERLNKHRTIVEIEGTLPESVTVGDSVADADANTAEVLIRNCVMRGNRARGLLLGSRGKIVIEGNTFHTPGAAILFEGDSRFWFEQAGVRDVVIRGNTFDNCNYGVWGTGTIQVGSGIAEEFRSTSRYNRNIRIENNLFRSFGRVPLLSLYSVDGLTFTGNRLEKTTDYPLPDGQESKLFDVTDSDDVKIEEPSTVSEEAAVGG